MEASEGVGYVVLLGGSAHRDNTAGISPDQRACAVRSRSFSRFPTLLLNLSATQRRILLLCLPRPSPRPASRVHATSPPSHDWDKPQGTLTCNRKDAQVTAMIAVCVGKLPGTRTIMAPKHTPAHGRPDLLGALDYGPKHPAGIVPVLVPFHLGGDVSVGANRKGSPASDAGERCRHE